MTKKLPKWAKVLLTVLIVVIGVKVAWGIAYPSGTWRYKLTVEVDTPEGVRTGSAVREAGLYTEPRILPEQGGVFFNITKGEAVVIDLGIHGTVFALLGGQDEARRVIYAIQEGGDPNLDISVKTRFVRFRDPADPKTVEAVRPDDFAAVFGKGVALKSVTIEMTREPVTTGVVERYLPWLLTIGKGNLGGGRFSGPAFYERLGAWDFRREAK